jgi:DNA-binding NtrC family response regulator
VLVVDDDAGVVDYLTEMLRGQGFAARGETSARAALARLEAEAFDVVLSDVEMPELRGLALMEAVHQRRADQLVVLMTAFGSIELAVEAMRRGAAHFVTKPFGIEELYAALDRVLVERRFRREIVRLRAAPSAAGLDGALVAASPAMKRLVAVAERAAQTDATVLLVGESGSGKGALARHLHASSRRREGPFVQINCATLPLPLVEAQLFGVKRGAFTDAKESRPGLFHEASGGTLFLDEVGELPLEAQPKLLQALETGRVRPVGASGEEPVDVRLVAATNRPLEEDVSARRFRSDLYYRLNVIRAQLPPLRERREDIEPLALHFLQRATQRLGREVRGLSAEAVRWLRGYHWPGNVRELANTIERAVALGEHDTVLLEDLAYAFGDAAGHDYLATAAAQERSLEEVERAYIRMVLESCEGNKSRAARVLRIDRRTLHRKLDLPEPDEG